jgi:rhamnose transport system permease protein
VNPESRVPDPGGYKPESRLLQFHRFQSASLARLAGPLMSLVVLAVIFTIIGRHFASTSNLQSILFTWAILAIASVAQGSTVITRNLDLSIGAIMASGAYYTLQAYVHAPALGPMLIPVAVAIGAMLGAINGVAVAYVRIPSLIATLGTMSIFRGLLYASANGQQINTDQLPTWLLDFVSSTVLGVPALAIVAIGSVLIMGRLLQQTQFGRTVYAVGSNPNAAAFYGLPAKRTILKTYMLGGGIAGLAGIMLAGEVGTVTVDMAGGWELQTLAAVVIGGTSLLGGSGSILGAALGALILTTIDNGLIQAGASGDWQTFVQGFVIVLAVALDVQLQHRQSGGIRLFAKRRRAVAK